MLQNDNDINRRWKGYFEGLLNEGNRRIPNREGVEKAMRAMENNKAVGPDNISIEVCKCLGEAGIDIVVIDVATVLLCIGQVCSSQVTYALTKCVVTVD